MEVKSDTTRAKRNTNGSLELAMVLGPTAEGSVGHGYRTGTEHGRQVNTSSKLPLACEVPLGEVWTGTVAVRSNYVHWLLCAT